MKFTRQYKFIAACFLSGMMLVASSCKKDFLNQVPDDRLSIDDVFKRQVTTEQYLANVYNQIRSETDWNTGTPWEGLSDEIDVTYNNYATYAMNLGNWDRNRGDYNYWTHYYKAIRSASFFLEHVDENKELTPELLQQFKGEARFLRAYFYFMLMRQYGPVVIMPEKTIAPDATIEEMSIPRSSYDDCVKYVAGEMDKALADVPEWQSNTRDYQRIKKAMILAYKSRLLLYAASPLFNGNTDYAEFLSKDGKQLISQQADVNKWSDAAAAAKAVIDMPYFELYKEMTNGKIDAMKSCKNVFLTDWNKEIIMARVSDMFSHDKNGSPYKVGGWSSWGPTQQVVDDFFMANGRSITDPLSGYVETGYSTAADAYTTANTYNMYVGREPRFYIAITYHGSKWLNAVAGAGGQPITVEMTNGGNSGKYSGANWSRTGYCMRKFAHPSSDLVQNRIAGRMEVHMRLGEIYLNYVEALNESDPTHPDILKYLNLIRERAGIPLYGDAALPAPTGQDAMRQAIRRERRIELAFESHRFFDTRRWKIAEQTDGGAFYGMNIEGKTNAEFFRRTLFETRTFDKKYYLWNIVQSELNRNKNLVENPGW
ncbi:RagB/SusD family nutrient uptake outer membrane protein [uncultured Chitinophaga sp.]|uniref:RagB/SusD family nutrient uptake outer membrane protein n=1 Tax=uncultured Chitinophaga sp. TaxID=339340 RepID=UPI0025EA5D17|nr:RagB/SusD family nutrient uptake outer membrane protein [uncultured Chitinophaga sp.]